MGKYSLLMKSQPLHFSCTFLLTFVLLLYFFHTILLLRLDTGSAVNAATAAANATTIANAAAANAATAAAATQQL